MVQLQEERMSYAQIMHRAHLVLTSTPENNPYHELDYWRIMPWISIKRRSALLIQLETCCVTFVIGRKGEPIDISKVIERFQFAMPLIYNAWQRDRKSVV